MQRQIKKYDFCLKSLLKKNNFRRVVCELPPFLSQDKGDNLTVRVIDNLNVFPLIICPCRSS